MPDIADLQARDRASRSFSLNLGDPGAPRLFHLLEPTTHEVRLASLRAGLGGQRVDAAAMALLERALLAQAITGWHGVTAADLLAQYPDQAAKIGGDLVPFDPAGVELLLNAQPGWSTTLWAALVDRLAQRGQLREEASGN
jgi:hypothetical protein